MDFFFNYLLGIFNFLPVYKKNSKNEIYGLVLKNMKIQL